MEGNSKALAIILIASLTLCGCGPKAVRCDDHLTPINAPATTSPNRLAPPSGAVSQRAMRGPR